MSLAVTSLRRQGSAVALLGFGSIALLAVSQPIWLVGSMVIWAYCLYLLFGSLEENIRDGESAPLASLGWPTLLTLMRGVLLAVVAGFLFTPMPLGERAYFPPGAYTLAVVLDHIDGRLARAMGRATLLGERLDMEVDAAGDLDSKPPRDPIRQAPSMVRRHRARALSVRARDRLASPSGARRARARAECVAPPVGGRTNGLSRGVVVAADAF